MTCSVASTWAWTPKGQLPWSCVPTLDYRQSGLLHQWSPIVLIVVIESSSIGFPTKSPLMTSNIPVSFKVRNIFLKPRWFSAFWLVWGFSFPARQVRESYRGLCYLRVESCQKYHRETQDTTEDFSLKLSIACSKSKAVFAWLTRGVPRALGL